MEQENVEISPEKKRGRPKKKQPQIQNEEKEVVTMAQKGAAELQNDVRNQVGNVFVSEQNYSVYDIQNRWRQLFQKYQELSPNFIAEQWGKKLGSNNPFIQNIRVKETSTRPLKLEKDKIQEALQNPESNEDIFRAFSLWLYYTNYVYHTLIDLYRSTPKYNYYFLPQYIDRQIDKNKLKQESQFVDKVLKRFDPKLTFKTIASQVALEGKCAYLVRTSYDKNKVNYVLLQKLNSDNVKITGFGSKQKFIVSFNMSIFLEPGYEITQYPKFIQDAWYSMIEDGIVSVDANNQKKFNPAKAMRVKDGHVMETMGDGRWMYWIPIPQDLVYVFYSDGSNPNVLPDTVGLFEDLASLGDYRWLQGNLLSRGINSIMTAEVPLASQPKPGADQTAISVDSILGFTDLFNQNISDTVLPFFAPFTEFKLHSIESQPESLDVIYDRVRDLIATSGNSALLSISDKPSISSVQTARMLQESKSDYLTRQFEDFLNNIINTSFDLSIQWRITVHSGIFYWQDEAKMTKELVLGGVTGLLPRLLSYYDTTIEDYHSSTLYLDMLDISIDDSDYQEANPVGRPALNQDEVTNDNTGASKDAGTDVSSIKVMSQICPCCGRKLSLGEKFLCMECLETYIEEGEWE